MGQAGALAQQIEPKGGFQSNEMLIGQPTKYSLSVRYPKSLQVVFPGDGYDFYPFELVNRQYFTTQTDSTTSYDSVVYFFTSFTVEAKLGLALPVFLVKGGDSTSVFARADSIAVVATVTEVPDSLALKSNSTPVATDRPVNALLILLVGLPVVFLLALLFAFNYNRVQRWFLLRRLNKRHVKFLERFNGYIDDLRQSSKEVPEEALLYWKQYMERIDLVKYTKMTTKELKGTLQQADVLEALKTIDRSIYGGQQGEALQQQFKHLYAYSIERYHKRIEQIKHGK